MDTTDVMKRLRILIIDDHHDNLKSTQMLLQIQGHDVLAESSGKAAIDVALQYDPHVIFLDLAMPGISGYDVARAMRDRGLRDSTMIVAMSGLGQPCDIERSRIAGLEEHLVKPVPLSEFRRVLARVAQLGGG